MRTIILGCFLFFSISLSAQQKSLYGVYHAIKNDLNTLWLCTDDYISINHYKDKEYIGTSGGTYTFDGKKLSIKLEYNDLKPDSVGLVKTINIQINDKSILADGLNLTKQVNKKQDLDGLWRITGRKSGEKLNTIARGDRKTIKLLVDGYFQWIAINPAEKGFYGTGGGKYTFKDGKYMEEIVFFSRDNSRVGHQLNFEGALKEGAWHHSGKSSKGDPIYEIWDRD